MTAAWPEVALGETCAFQNGGTPSKKVPAYFGGDIPWLTGADIEGPSAGACRTFLTDAGIEASPACVVPEGTILLVTRTGVGKVAIANRTLSFSQDITALTPNPTQLDRKYLLRFLQTEAGRFKAESRGATIKGITREVVASTKIPLPPLDEQRRIAAILDKADEVRSKRQAALETLETLSQAIFIEMFGDPTLPSYPLRDSEGKCVPMGIVSEIQTGKLDANAAVEGGEFPFFTCSRQTLTIDKAAFHGRAVLVAGNGDLNVKYYEGHFNAYQRTYVIKSSDERVVHPRFLHGFLDLYVAKLRQQAIGGVIQYIKLPYLKDALIRIPPWSQQEEFVSRIEGANSGIVSLRTSTTQINQLFASLQQKAFQGTL